MSEAGQSQQCVQPTIAAVLVIDSVTKLDARDGGRVVVCGSHGGTFSAMVALRAGVGGIVLNDAAVGRDRAGVRGLDVLDRHGIPGATAGYESAEIGNGDDAMRSGVVSHANASAAHLGCAPGMTVARAAALMVEATRGGGLRHPGAIDAAPGESRHLLRSGRPRTWALDSASLARDDDAGDILFTGSHGQLLGGDRTTALGVDALAAVFNDAGRHGEELLSGRLSALDARRVAAATVDAQTARIGDGRSTYFDGVVSAVNHTAAQLGATRGMTSRAFAETVLQSPRSMEGA